MSYPCCASSMISSRLAMPEQLTLRQIKVVVDNPGFRVQSFYIVTTLTDTETYSAADIADLYYRRWDVELFFRDIKTTMGMDILRCLRNVCH